MCSCGFGSLAREVELCNERVEYRGCRWITEKTGTKEVFAGKEGIGVSGFNKRVESICGTKVLEVSANL
jgi:hypothetical protein